MGKFFYFTLCIFCGILSQEIWTLSQENFNKSSVRLVRKKRIIDDSWNVSHSVPIENVPYIVSIQRFAKHTCSGIILSPIIIITAYHCIHENDGTYRILSGSRFRSRGTFHNIIRLIPYPRFVGNKIPNDLALLVIYPAIDLEKSPNKKITLHDGVIPPNTLGTISGWGCIRITEEGNVLYSNELRSIQVPILDNDDCQIFYDKYLFISNKEICTFDRRGEKRSCYGDSGGPLVVNGTLVGILAGKKRYDYQHYPDVFMNMSYRPYHYWIASILAQIRV